MRTMATIPKLTIVAVTYPGHSLAQIRHFITSLQCQTVDRWKCIMFMDGYCPYYNRKELWLEDDFRFQLLETNCRGDYGHPNRKDGTYLADTEYICYQNVDNSLHPPFVGKMLEAAETNPEAGILISDCTHNYALGKFYDKLEAYPVQDQIDFTNFIIKTELAKEIFDNIPEWVLKWSGLDGFLATKAVEINPNWVKVPYILSVHN